MNPFLSHELAVHLAGCKSCQMIAGKLVHILEFCAQSCLDKGAGRKGVKEVGWLPSAVMESGVHDDNDGIGERAKSAR